MSSVLRRFLALFFSYTWFAASGGLQAAADVLNRACCDICSEEQFVIVDFLPSRDAAEVVRRQS